VKKTLRLKSPAKVNLRLEILKKRGDGYHEIRTIFQKLNLSDTIQFSLGKERGITITTSHTGLPVGENNLVYKAARAILSRSGYRGGVYAHIEKRIPLGAGLGGGSSNAAATLKALNQLLGLGLSIEELMTMGIRIGADVPFFFLDAGAIATGIGEKLERVELPHLWYILIYPNFEVLSRWAYQNFQATRGLRQTLPARAGAKASSVSIPSNLQSLDRADKGLTKMKFRIKIREFLATPAGIPGILLNDLEEVVSKEFPQIGQMKEILSAAGSMGTLMTGSGPTVFGLFSDRKDSLRAYRKIKNRVKENGWIVLQAHSIP
jgi:4-diphosphocytidyl-2-C-methyl-D-erythritol kinase